MQIWMDGMAREWGTSDRREGCVLQGQISRFGGHMAKERESERWGRKEVKSVGSS